MGGLNWFLLFSDCGSYQTLSTVIVAVDDAVDADMQSDGMLWRLDCSVNFSCM